MLNRYGGIMTKYFCDVCGKETMFEDLHKLSVNKVVDDKPSMQPKEMCVFCKEKLISLLSEVSNG